MSSEINVLDSIDNLYQQLFSKEKQIADYIKDHPDEVVMMNIPTCQSQRYQRGNGCKNLQTSRVSGILSATFNFIQRYRHKIQ